MPKGRVFSITVSCVGGFEELIEWRNGKDSSGRHFKQLTRDCFGCYGSVDCLFVDKENAANDLSRVSYVSLYDGTYEELSRFLKEKKERLEQEAIYDSLVEIEQNLRQGRRV